MPTQSILFVEDNPELSRSITRNLKTEYRIDSVPTLTGAFGHIAEKTPGYDLVLLDRVLPDGDGLELIRHIHQDSPQTKICILSHKDTESERIFGLEHGADCYLPKPTSLQEIRAQLHVLLRRSKIATPHGLHFGAFELIENECLLRSPAGNLSLSRRQTHFLAIFFRSQDGRVTQEQLLDIFWRKRPVHEKSIVHVNIQRLRKKIAPLKLEINSLYGLGYQLLLPESNLAKTV